jgi:hypothetical protein
MNGEMGPVCGSRRQRTERRPSASAGRRSRRSSGTGSWGIAQAHLVLSSGGSVKEAVEALRSDEEVTEAGRARVQRHHPDGSFTGAGSIELGLHRELVERLEARLAELPARQRGTVAWYPAEVSVVASLHGLPDTPVRDAILRHVLETHLTAE